MVRDAGFEPVTINQSISNLHRLPHK